MKSQLLTIMCAAAVLAAGVGRAENLCKGPVGLQLYSLRDQLAKNVPDTLAEVAGWGIKDVELAGTYGMSPAEFKEQLKSHGLVAVSAHFPYEKWRDDPEGLLAQAKELGVHYAGCAWIPHKGDFTEEDAKEAAQVFNKAGQLANKQHITFFYHTHGYEFRPFGKGTLFDVMMKETNPKLVHYQMDIFWVAHAGVDPVRLLGMYPGRWVSLHLKDMRKGTPTGLFTGSSPPTNDVVFGTGQLDLPAILNEANIVGVKYYFIEDESPISEQQIPQSLRYLRGEK